VERHKQEEEMLRKQI